MTDNMIVVPKFSNDYCVKRFEDCEQNSLLAEIYRKINNEYERYYFTLIFIANSVC